MLKRRFDGKTIGALFIMVVTMCLSAFAATRSADAWKLDPSDFRYDMSLYFNLANEEYENLDAYEIGAFIDDECRGLAERIKVPEGVRCLYMRIRSNSTDAQEISFYLREKASGKTVVLRGADPVVFKSNEMVGKPSAPYTLTAWFDVKIAAADHGSVDFKDGLYAEGSQISVIAVPDEGYSFKSWSDGDTQAERTLTVNGDIDLTASFAVKSYTAEFRIGDEVIDTRTFEFGANVTAPEAPAREGYTFTGWEDLPVTMPAKDIVVTGGYAVKTYRLVFMAGDVEVDAKELTFGSDITAPEAPAREGYTFTGWEAFPSTMPAEDLVVKAIYTVNSYKLTFSIDGKVVEEKEVAFGSAVAAPEAEEKTGYTFSGWGDVPATMPAKDLAFNATYSINSYKLTFMVDDVVIEEKEMTYGEAITAPSVPDKEGNKFNGWLNLPETMPAEDLVVYGSYEKNSHLLTFMIDDQIVEEKVLVYGADITVPEVPAKEGYTFSGWGEVPATMPAKDLVIKATYNVNSYKLTFSIDGSVVEDKEVAFGSDITAPEAPARPGYTFSGWGDVPATMPAKDLEFNASYTLNSYSVSFVIDGVTVKSEELPYGAAITLPEAPEKEGYTFQGWGDVPASMPDKAVVLTAVYKVNSYKLVFMVGDVVIEEKMADYGSEIKAPTVPDKDGHKFMGWLNLPETMPASDLTVLGSYEANTHLVTFMIGDEMIGEAAVTFGEPVNAPEAPAKEGYTFAGWIDIPSSMPAQDIIVNGSYVINNYKVTFTIGDDVIATLDVEYGAAFTAPEAPAIEGYTFAGWGELPAAMPAQDLAFNGSYSINSYKLSFVIDDVTVEETELPYGAAITAPATPDKEGHRFEGWFNLTETMPAADLTVYGTYEKNIHLLSFVIDGVVIEEKAVAFGTDIAAPEAPAKEGHTFTGWEETPATMPAKDLVINGSYSVNSYRLTFLISGETLETAEIHFGASIAVPEAPAREGYTFSGWGEVPTTMPANDLEFSGSYAVNSYKLTFVIDDETVEEKEIAYGETITAPATPDKEGHRFEGWFNLTETMPAADLTVYGTYEKNSHLLSFVIDGEILEEKVVMFGSDISAPEAPAKEGYSFIGWEEMPATMPANDLTVNGSYAINSYKLTFSVDGETVEEMVLPFGEAITAPEMPAKEGFSFSGWGGVPAAMPATNLDITGEYTLNSYKLTFVIDEEVVVEREVAFGETIEAPATPDKEGHRFEGWFNLTETMPASDLTVFGTYEKNMHLITFMVDGHVVEERVLLFGSEITAPEAPVKVGHTFAGWEEMPATMPAKDVVVNGSFNANLYKAVFAIAGETVAEIELPFGAELTAPEAPEKEGHTFAGWGEVPATMPAADIDFAGTYTLNTYLLTIIIDNEVVEEKTMIFGEPITAPATPDREGHKFEGWFNMVETMPASDLSIFGTYVKNSHLLTFVADGQIVEEKVVVYGDEITAPEAPVKEGYTFAGWEDLPATMPAADLTVNALYNVNLYTLVFMIDEEVVAEIELPYGAEVAAPEAPAREGYTFLGWNNLPETMPAANLMLSGLYQANIYKLTVMLNDEVVEERELPFGAAIELTEPTVPEGWKFEGWLDEVPATMPATDLTVRGTMTEDEQSGVGSVAGGDDTVTVFNLNGVLLYKDIKASEIKERLVPGLYIINGKKVMIR